MREERREEEREREKMNWSPGMQLHVVSGKANQESNHSTTYKSATTPLASGPFVANCSAVLIYSIV